MRKTTRHKQMNQRQRHPQTRTMGPGTRQQRTADTTTDEWALHPPPAKRVCGCVYRVSDHQAQQEGPRQQPMTTPDPWEHTQPMHIHIHTVGHTNQNQEWRVYAVSLCVEWCCHGPSCCACGGWLRWDHNAPMAATSQTMTAP
jgi:hypothetical protein